MDRKEIERILFEIDVPAGIKGFEYIVDAVEFLNEDMDMSITKELYPKIAKKNSTNSTSVERAIRYALKICRNRKTNIELVKHYIGLTNCGNANSIKMLYKCINNKEDNG